MLKLTRQEEVAPADLLEGFRRLFPTLRLHFIKSGIFMIIGFVAMYIGAAVFFITPFADPIREQLMLLASDEALLTDTIALQNALLPMLEPADSAECREFIKIAYELSEQYDTPVLIRTTTRIAHARSLTETAERTELELKGFTLPPL